MSIALQPWLDAAAAWPAAWRYVVVPGMAAAEYLVPFMPSDVVILAGAVLQVVAGHPPYVLWALTVLAGTLGGVVAYELSRWLFRTGRGQKFRKRYAKQLDAVEALFSRFGPVFLAMNRFVPGLRAFFFVAAATARVPRRAVWIWGAVSSAAWNALLFGVAMALGHNVPELEAFLGRVNSVLLVVAVVFVLVCIVLFKRYTQSGGARESDAPAP